jgi:Ca2+/Na+ antiporter
MNRRTIARVISVVLFSYLFALWLVHIEKDTMMHYRSLSHDALLAELAEKNKGNFDGKFATMLFGVAIIVLIIDGLTWVIELAIDRISPPPPGGGDPQTITYISGPPIR